MSRVSERRNTFPAACARALLRCFMTSSSSTPHLLEFQEHEQHLDIQRPCRVDPGRWALAFPEGILLFSTTAVSTSIRQWLRIHDGRYHQQTILRISSEPSSTHAIASHRAVRKCRGR